VKPTGTAFNTYAWTEEELVTLKKNLNERIVMKFTICKRLRPFRISGKLITKNLEYLVGQECGEFIGRLEVVGTLAVSSIRKMRFTKYNADTLFWRSSWSVRHRNMRRWRICEYSSHIDSCWCRKCQRNKNCKPSYAMLEFEETMSVMDEKG
jgi:hypothetical protein